MRVFAVSDIHVDYQENMNWIRDLSRTAYRRDTLILAGDVSHDFQKIETAFNYLLERFNHVFYVPGNHELWNMKSVFGDSLEKFHQLLALCGTWGVRTEPGRVGSPDFPVWIVPLFSWYVKPEEGPESLFVEKPGEDPGLEIWSDHYFVKWPPGMGSPAAYFLGLNRSRLDRSFDAPIISFSHFLPRIDLIFSRESEDRGMGPIKDTHRSFNFSRVAGSKALERQIRRLGSRIHVYGHQHRNRFRMVDEVLYVSQCLGYQHEREDGKIRYLQQGPRLIWERGRSEAGENAIISTGSTV